MHVLFDKAHEFNAKPQIEHRRTLDSDDMQSASLGLSRLPIVYTSDDVRRLLLELKHTHTHDERRELSKQVQQCRKHIKLRNEAERRARILNNLDKGDWGKKSVVKTSR